MKIIAAPEGMVLVFKSIKEIEGVIEHLSGQVEWAKEEEIPPPYIYAMYDENVPPETIDALLVEIKDKKLFVEE